MSDNETQRPGLAVLVGAGPGEPGLLTVEGARWLAQADVVIYDRLVHPDILALCPQRAERIYAGKRPGEHTLTQEQINALLVDRCRAGKLVVRLKGGDPLIFGRGGEEATALKQAGLPLRIVPGVTAALAAAAYAGIPLTHRGLASTVTFVTGHEDPAKAISSVDLATLAKVETVVFYMGVGRLAALAEGLMAAGRAGETPTAVVERASLPDQRVVLADLATIADAVDRAGIQPPALLIVGEVAKLHQTLHWREQLPLNGRRVIVTRDPEQGPALTEALELLGAEVISAPTIVIEPLDDYAFADAALLGLPAFDWVVFTSPNGVRAFADRYRRLGLDARALCRTQLAALGPGTADAMTELFLRPDLVPGTFTTSTLADALLTVCGPDTRLLLLRSNLATPTLPQTLRLAGAEVQDVAIYRTGRPAALSEEAVEALQQGRVDWITFTSASTVTNFLDLLDGRADLAGLRLAAIGPVTADALERVGLKPTIVADEHTIQGLAGAIAAHVDP